MKIFIALLLLVLPAFCTTTVTGNIKNLQGGAVGTSSNAIVRFILRGTGNAQPVITGTGALAPTSANGIWYTDIPADSNGNVSGTIYSTRNSAGTGAGDITVSGSGTAVYYDMVVIANGMQGPATPIHAKSGATLDISNVTPITTTPVVTAPTGDSTYLRLDGGNSPITGGFTSQGNNTFTGSNTFSKFNNRVYIDGTKYAFSSAGIQAAHDGSDCPSSGCIIDVGPNSFNLTSAVTFTKPVCLIGAGVGQTVLTVTTASITAFTFATSGVAGNCFEHIRLNSNVANGSANQNALQFTNVGETLIFDDVLHGFFGGIRVTGDGVSTQSTGFRVDHILIDNFCGSGAYGIETDHVGDFFLEHFRIYQTGGGAGACTTSNGMIIDRGSQGMWIDNGTIENGLHSAIIQNTNLGGSYGGSPAAIFMTSDVTFDFAGGGTDLVFDSTLGTSATRFYCNGCWFAAAGQGSSPVAAAMGVDIEGGADINFIGGVCRFNQGWCAKINTAGKGVEFSEMEVYDNNQGNTAGVGGFLVTANAADWSVKNLPTCGNKGIDAGGHMYYCVDYSAAASGSGSAFGNNATNNINGPNNIPAAIGITTGFEAPYFLVDDTFPALSGGVRLSEAKAQIKSKNHAANADTQLIAKDGSDDIVQLGDTAGVKTNGALTISASTGSAINADYKGSGTLTYTAITAPGCQEQPLTITNAAAGDACWASTGASDIGGTFYYGGCRISAANTAQVKVCATTTGTPTAVAWTGWALH